MSFHFSRRGFGLLEVAVILAFVTFLLVPVASYLSSNLKNQRRQEPRGAYKQVESYLVDSFVYRMETFFSALANPGPPQCTQAGQAFTSGVSGVGPILPIQSAAGGFQVRRLNPGSLPTVPDTFHEQGKSRCAIQSNLSVSASLQGQSTVYFCVEFVPTGTVPLALAADGPVFAELRFDLTNFETNSAVICENYHDDPPSPGANFRGLNVGYVIYWQKKINDSETQYFNHRGVYKVFHD